MKILRTPLAWTRWLSLALCLGMLLETNTPGFKPQMIAVPGAEVRLGTRENDSVREYARPPLEVSRYEITTQQYAHYLNDSKQAFNPEHPAVQFEQGRWVPRTDRFHPMTAITAEQATEYAAWLGEGFRLPQADEWEALARGGLDGAPFPWGWGMTEKRARFGGISVAPVGQYAPNAYGLYDMAGNVFELAHEGDHLVLCGGAWSERSEEMLKVFKRSAVSMTYADRDAGFRVVRSSEVSR